MTDLERQLAAGAARPQLFGGQPADAARMNENLRTIHIELDAPRESWLARLLRRIGVSDLSVPLVTATPALRRSWFIAVAIAVLFALSVSANAANAELDRIAVFLTVAPLVPLMGVALAFGKGVDPTHDLVVAAPRDTFTVFLIRACTVLIASTLVLLLGSVLLPVGGAYRFAWILPALAATTLTMALSSRFDPRRVAGAVAATWVITVVLVTGGGSVAAMFGPVTQFLTAGVALIGAVVLVARRTRVDPLGGGVSS